MPNGVDIEKFAGTPKARPVREEWNIPAERRLLLCVSRIDYQKNQKMLIPFLKQLTGRGEEVHLLLIGPVTAPWYAEELMALARQCRVADRVTLVPGLGAGTIRGWSPPSGARIALCCLRWHEPFGIVVLEAWAAGLPVLAAKVGGCGGSCRTVTPGCHFEPGIPATLMSAYEPDRPGAGAARIDRRLGAAGGQMLLLAGYRQGACASLRRGLPWLKNEGFCFSAAARIRGRHRALHVRNGPAAPGTRL